MRISLLLGGLLLYGCSMVKKTPAAAGNDLYTAAQEWKVQINDGWLSAKTIRYGNYTTSSRRNGMAAETNITFIKAAENPFNFYVKDSSEQILVQCLRTPRATFADRPLPAALAQEPTGARFFYALINGIQLHPLVRWELILKDPHYLELNDNKPAGILRSPEEDIRITAHNRMGIVNAYEKACYEFHYRGAPVAAVMPGAQPRVWVSNRITQDVEKILAAAIGALLMR
ncbi:hypothetical protein [Chitinophaga japonensis]|uniref:Lipoprotein n=1 Tax=Chitinophaga japonensis TaxID=104662 RepID=A0A562TDS9_CHIJA|nr:hypothetical protein [Chitinophaga japonensis]TWI91672.1 hypothetical protein LX66_1048 [Chitinophaga japonensis]